MCAVTAIVPTFRRPTILARALASIAAQTLQPLEVLVVDDHSSSLAATAHVAASVGIGNIRAVANKRSPGVSGARNTGMLLARGEYLAFLDDDDEWDSRFLAEGLALCLAHALDMVCVDLILCSAGGGERPGKTAPDNLALEAFLTRNPGVGGSNLVIRRARLLEVGGFDESLPAMEDRELGLRLSLCPQLRYRPLHRPLVRCHKHDGPQLSKFRTEASQHGVRRFFELHGQRMSATERLEFRARVIRLWGVDELGRLMPEVWS